MDPTDNMICSMAEERIGTCIGSPENTLEEMYPGVNADKITLRQWEIFDNIAYECPYCGWTVEAGTQENFNGEDICQNCYKEEIEE